MDLYESLPEDIEEGSNPRASFAGCLVRLSGHDFMDFRIHPDGTTTGGSDACVNFEDPDNKGLAECITQFGLVSAYQQSCTKASLADFIVIAGEAVMGRTATSYDAEDYYADDTLAK